MNKSKKREAGDDDTGQEISTKKERGPIAKISKVKNELEKSMDGHSYFNNMWAEAQSQLRVMYKLERNLGEGRDIPVDRRTFFDELVPLYFEYMDIYRKLDEVCDQMVHPQKLLLVRPLLDLVLARILELRDVMTATELSEYHYFGDHIHLYKLLPEDIELHTPRYYKYQRDPDIDKRNKFLNEYLDEKEANEEAQAKEAKEIADKIAKADKFRGFRDGDMEEPLSAFEAAEIIQCVERQRQGLLEYAYVRYGWDDDDREKARRKRAKKLELFDQDKAATIIQKLVRGFLARKRVARRRELELNFLGIHWAPWKVHEENNYERFRMSQKAKEIQAQIEKHLATRRRTQQIYKLHYEDALVFFETKLRFMEAPEMAERMKYQLRTWMLHIKEKQGKLPDIPKAEFGGSRYIFCPKTLPPEVLEKALEAENGKKKKKKKGKDKAKEKKKKDKKKKKGKGKKDANVIKFGPPVNFEEMVKVNKSYNRLWRHKDEKDNPDQKHESDIIIKEKRQLVGKEVRAEVDTMMKAELQYLKMALEKKKGKKKKGKGKKGKGKGKKGKGKGKGKKGKKKGKKKKKGKDLTPDRTFESLFTELIDNKIIKRYPKVGLEDLIGERSLVNETIRHYYSTNAFTPGQDTNYKMPFGPHPPPSFGDIKRALKDICIVPMGSETVHKLAPVTKSVLLAGAPGSGKTSLVHAICNELGATLYDLTASNIAGKYPGKPGLNMLIHLLNKVGRLTQPTIILIDEVEKAYMKKVPKTDKTEPKRLKKQLTKFLKTITPDDRIMLIGCTSEPWVAKMKPLKKDFQKIIYIPKPDHGSRISMWRRMLEDHLSEFSNEMCISLLSKLSDCWTLGNIKTATEKAMKKHYKVVDEEWKEHMKPLEFDPSAYLSGKPFHKTVKIGRKRVSMNEFIAQLTVLDPIFLEQEKAWNTWFNKTPLQKARIASIITVGADDKKKKKGKNDKGKKGKPEKGKKGKKGKNPIVYQIDEFPQLRKEPLDDLNP